MVVNLMLPLGLIKNTVFELDKDLYFGEVILLRLVTHGYSKISFVNTDGMNPDTQASVPDNAPTTSDVALYVAVEQNQEIINQLISQVNTSGMQILLPYVWYSKFNPGGNSSSQNVSIRYNRGQELRLRKIYHSVFNNTESTSTAYDHNNIDGDKVIKYYTLLNNTHLQEFDIDCTHLVDYNLIREKIKGSAIQSANVYQYNWFHLEDFTNIFSLDPENKNNLVCGLPLDIEQKWTTT